ncbi:MAG: hypothetical protein II969_14510 [Anaerolineaceae bacterium]|nr:hypothetical protein [Anaerolineaceae bacterium]
MIDKITAKIKRYPFQTGIIVGVIACLLLAGVISLFQDHGRTLSGNSEIIQQDYLRMTINEYSYNNDELLASWRYDHLGGKAEETLKLMRADNSVSPYDLVSFAKAIGKSDAINPINEFSTDAQGTPTNPRKGLSGFGKILLIVLGLGVVAAGILYVVSLVKTKRKRQRRAEINQQRYEAEPVNMITPEKARAAANDTPDTLFDLDSLFPQTNDSSQKKIDNQNINQEPELTEERTENDDNASTFEKIKPDDKVSELNTEGADEPKFEESVAENIENTEIPDREQKEAVISENKITEDDAVQTEMNQENVPEETEIMPEVSADGKSTTPAYNITDYEISDEQTEESGMEPEVQEEVQEEVQVDEELPDDKPVLPNTSEEQTEPEKIETPEENNDAEKPLVETDTENESENEDELLKMIRNSKTNSDEIIGKSVTASIDGIETAAVPEKNDSQEKSESVEKEISNQPSFDQIPDDEETPAVENEILIHYQSGYKIGNDMYDEVFSIDQGDTFRGECGISIGETLNNTEPKAVTAFEVWLFDKDDIHTATWYLMSDFALSNDGIRGRLEQRGKCDRIRKGDLYTLETETLIVEIKVLELEYGNEMEEKNSYFTNVVFDVIAKTKNNNM